MTEGEWLSGTNPDLMLRFLEGKASARKVRLFACACCRAIAPLIAGDPAWRAVAVAERFADGEANAGELHRALRTSTSTVATASVLADPLEAARETGRRALGRVLQERETQLAVHLEEIAGQGDRSAFWVARATPVGPAAVRAVGRFYARNAQQQQAELSTAVRNRAHAEANRRQANLLRELFGNPFRRLAFDPIRLGLSARQVRELAGAIYADHSFADLPVLADAMEEVGCDHAELLGHFRQPGEHARGCWALDVVLGKG